MIPELEKVIAKLTKDGNNIKALFGSISAEQAEMTMYESELDVWHVKHVLAHLIFAEQEFLRLYANILEGGTGVAEDFDIDQYNFEAMIALKQRSLDSLVEEFDQTRSAMITFVEKLSIDDLNARGRHPALGVTTLLDMIKMIYVHSQMHARDVKKIIS